MQFIVLYQMKLHLWRKTHNIGYIPKAIHIDLKVKIGNESSN